MSLTIEAAPIEILAECLRPSLAGLSFKDFTSARLVNRKFKKAIDFLLAPATMKDIAELSDPDLFCAYRKVYKSHDANVNWPPNLTGLSTADCALMCDTTSALKEFAEEFSHTEDKYWKLKQLSLAQLDVDSSNIESWNRKRTAFRFLSNNGILHETCAFWGALAATTVFIPSLSFKPADEIESSHELLVPEVDASTAKKPAPPERPDKPPSVLAKFLNKFRKTPKDSTDNKSGAANSPSSSSGATESVKTPSQIVTTRGFPTKEVFKHMCSVKIYRATDLLQIMEDEKRREYFVDKYINPKNNKRHKAPNVIYSLEDVAMHLVKQETISSIVDRLLPSFLLGEEANLWLVKVAVRGSRTQPFGQFKNWFGDDFICVIDGNNAKSFAVEMIDMY